LNQTWHAYLLRHGISSPKQTTLAERRSFIVLCFEATENIFTDNRTLDCFFEVVTFVTVISSSKQTTLVLAPFFYRASFRDTAAIFIGNRTQD
jgi:hypothetical protein